MPLPVVFHPYIRKEFDVRFLAVVLILSCCQIASAMPTFGSNCAGCHAGSGGDVVISPNPVDLVAGSASTVSFDVTSNPGEGVLSLVGLDAVGLDATVGPGWTDGGGYYYSDIIEGVGQYLLDLNIGFAAVEGQYAVNATFAGQPGFWSGQYVFDVSVGPAIPEPSTALLLLSGLICAAVILRK